MSGPDEVPKPWTDAVVKKVQKVRNHNIGFAEGAVSLIVLGGTIAIDRFCEKNNRQRPQKTWEARSIDASPAASFTPSER